MAITYEAIATNTLGSAQASVTFSSIPSTYTDLLLQIVYSTSATTGNAFIRFNSDSASNYSDTNLFGNGTSAGSNRDSSVTEVFISYYGTTATTEIVPIKVNIQNYANTTTYKTLLSRADNVARGAVAIVGLWRSTSAINSIYIGNSNNNFAIGSTFNLFGIKAA